MMKARNVVIALAGIALGSVVLLVVGTSEYGHSGGANSTAVIPGGSIEARDSILKDVDRRLSKYLKLGVLSSMDATGAQVVVTVAPAFYDLSFAQKRSFATLLARKAGGGDYVPVSFHDYYTGREVAEFTAFGFKMKSRP